MDTPLNPQSRIDIMRIVAEARQARSDALGELIAVGSRKALAWFLRTLDSALHSMLMSPRAPTSVK